MITATQHVRQFHSNWNSVVDFPPRSFASCFYLWLDVATRRSLIQEWGEGVPNSNTSRKTVITTIFIVFFSGICRSITPNGVRYAVILSYLISSFCNLSSPYSVVS
jgi:hypothetical protein